MDETNELLWKLRAVRASLITHKDNLMAQVLIDEDRNIFAPEEWDFLIEIDQRIRLIESQIRSLEDRRRFGR